MMAIVEDLRVILIDRTFGIANSRDIFGDVGVAAMLALGSRNGRIVKEVVGVNHVAASEISLGLSWASTERLDPSLAKGWTPALAKDSAKLDLRSSPPIKDSCVSLLVGGDEIWVIDGWWDLPRLAV